MSVRQCLLSPLRVLLLGAVLSVVSYAPAAPASAEGSTIVMARDFMFAPTALKVAAGSTRVQAIEFGGGPNPRTTGPLESLAIATGGSYRYIDVLRYNSPSE